MMRKIKYCFIFMVSAVGMQQISFAQQKPMYSQYMVNKYLVNPANAGNTGYTNIDMVGRQQYMGFVNAPRSFIFSIDSRLLEDSYILRLLNVKKNPEVGSRARNVGLGASIYNDRNGIINRTGFELTYAYHIALKDNYQLSFGLSFSGYQFKLDDGDSYVSDPNDPLLENSSKTFFVPDANAGVYFAGKGFYTGFSITELFGSGIKLGENKMENYQTLRHFYLITGYKWGVAKDLVIEPSFLVSSTADQFKIEGGARVIYMRNYWMGVNYRSNKTMIFLAGLRVDGFIMSYAYDANMGAIQNYGGGSHEILIGIQLGENSTRRFRWLRPDVSGIED